MEVKASPVIAGTEATNTLVIRNPFPDQVVIETIEAPSSAPLLPRTRRATAENLVQEGDKESFWRRLISSLRAFEVKEVSLGPLVAHFPQPRGRAFNIEVEQDSYVTFKTPLGPQDSLNMTVQRSANVNFDTPPQQSTMRSDGGVEGMQIPSHQEDIASFELRTAHWLLVTPKVLQLYAVIGYRLGNELRRQAVPLSLCIYPAVMAIVVGGICGGILGYAAPQTNLNKSIIRRGEQLRTTLARACAAARAVVGAKQGGQRPAPVLAANLAAAKHHDGLDGVAGRLCVRRALDAQEQSKASGWGSGSSPAKIYGKEPWEWLAGVSFGARLPDRALCGYSLREIFACNWSCM